MKKNNDTNFPLSHGDAPVKSRVVISNRHSGAKTFSLSTASIIILPIRIMKSFDGIGVYQTTGNRLSFNTSF